MRIQDMVGIAVVFVVLGIVLTMGGNIVQDVNDEQYVETATCNKSTGDVSGCSAAFQISNSSLDALLTFGSWQNTLALVIIAAVIIGVLVTYLVVKY